MIIFQISLCGEVRLKEEELDVANETLREALDILNKNFNFYDNDSADDSLNRMKSKMDIYKKIIDAYDEVISQSYVSESEDSLLDLERRLKNLE